MFGDILVLAIEVKNKLNKDNLVPERAFLSARKGGFALESAEKIQILLSTYNGEAYLRQQLDSYVNLDGFDKVKVLIRDDGSSDGSVDIIKEYVEKYGFELIEGENIGLNASLHALCEASDPECKYFAFSDQDDVWLPDKLSRAREALDALDNSVPNLYAASSSLTDVELNVTGHTLIPKRPLTFYNAMIQNVCVGHTQVCNRALIEILRQQYSDDIYVHDSWTYLVASAFGKVIYDDKQTTLYRQHGNNAIGYKSGFSNFVMRLKRLKLNKSRCYSYQLKAFYDCYGKELDSELSSEVERYFAKQRGFFKRLGYIMTTKMYRQTKIEGIVFRMMYLFGKYNLKNNSKKEKIGK